MKYIDADKLIAEIEERIVLLKGVNSKGDYAKGSIDADMGILEYITSLQHEQPIIEEDWVEKRKQECGYRRLLANGIYQCERYEGVFGPCDGRCSWIVDYPKLKELEERKQPKSTCKTCGFYENNCPFIRGKLIPYPNKVCEDYTYSAMKEQEQPKVDLDKLVNEEFARHSRTTEYGLEATYDRAELYQLIKRLALVFNAREEE